MQSHAVTTCQQEQTGAPTSRLIRVSEVTSRTGVTKTHLYRLMAAGKFPRAIKVTEGTSAWVESEIAQWIADRIAASRRVTA
jgi:prophage regulatory protein